MKRVSVVCLLLSFWTGALLAQSSNGYIFFGPGALAVSGEKAAMLYYGGGGEGILHKIVGVGGELGGVTSTHYRESVGLADANGYVHFTSNRRARFDPFVTGGYTLMFNSRERANLFNVGGGVNCWLGKSLGLRLEFRDHVQPGNGSAAHLLGFRVGLAFRGAVD